MPLVTKITESPRTPNRRKIFLDGALAFACNVNVVARFHLRAGLVLRPDQVEEILQGEVRQECFDKAMKLLQSRLHSRSELHRKLMRGEYGEGIVDGVLDDLLRLGYVNDEQFAKTKALSASEHKYHGRRRAFMELLKSGVKSEVAQRALDDVYTPGDGVAAARLLAKKKASSLLKLEPAVARRRLIGMLQRRGFEYDAIKPAVEEILGPDHD